MGTLPVTLLWPWQQPKCCAALPRIVNRHHAGVLCGTIWRVSDDGILLSSTDETRRSPQARVEDPAGVGDEVLYQRVLEADPHHVATLGNYAYFLTSVRGDHDGAEVLYRRALEADPQRVSILGDYAVFLTDVCGDHDGAEALYRRALQADPRHVGILGDYGYFLTDVRGDHDGAEALYRRALEADPEQAGILGEYANFLTAVRGDHDCAEALYLRALEADPRHADILGNYALFLKNVRGDNDGAEALYRRALQANPEHAEILSNYGYFLSAVRGNHDGADTLYRRALQADPKDAHILGCYARTLFIKGHDGQAERLATEAIARSSTQQEPLRAECYFYLLAHVPTRRAASIAALKKLLDRGVSTGSWSFSHNLTRCANDPRLPLLEAVATALGNGDPTGLEVYPEWETATA